MAALFLRLFLISQLHIVAKLIQNLYEGLIHDLLSPTDDAIDIGNENYEQFRVGQMIRCYSVPHLLDRTFPLVKLSLRLDTAAKQITLGTAARQSLTRIYKDVQETEDEEDPATEQELDDIRDRINDIQSQIDGMAGIDDWVHQIDGTTVHSGTINFITVT